MRPKTNLTIGLVSSATTSRDNTIPYYLVIIIFGERSVYNNKLFRKMEQLDLGATALETLER
jgi:hypothetical protein